MQAQEIPLSMFLNKGKNFIIPVYQRNYDWKRKQCAQLLKDIESVQADQLYFIGSIVHKRKSNLITQAELVIIDGQQRITTITLFLLRIAELFKEHGDILYQQIWDNYIQNRYEDGEEKLKLKPIISDFEVFKSLVNGNTENISNGNRILDNYLFFRENITTYEHAKKLYKNFNQLTIVEIALSNEDDPQKIFQSLNSTGLELSQADLIRNYLLMNLEYGYQEKIFQNYWSVIEKNCHKVSLNESRLSYFFRDYLTLKFNSIPSYNNIFESFKEKFADINNDEKNFEKELDEMKRYSNYYYQLINPELVGNNRISKHLENLDKLEVTVAYPFLLSVLYDFDKEEIDENTLIRIIKLVQSFVFRRFICGVPTNALNKIFMTLHNNSNKLRKKFPTLSYFDSIALTLSRYTSYQRFPTDDEVKEALKTKDIYSIRSKNKLYLFERLENEYDDFQENDIDLFENENISIEHIFPQNPSSEWKNQLNAQELTEMEARRNTLANLTVVINNSSLGNRSFIEKRDLNQENSKGYKYSKLKLNDYLANLEKWDLVALEERGNLLIEKFLKIWEFPELPYIEEVPEEEVSILDIADATGKLVKYYILNGNKIEKDSFIGMYKDVIKYLYSDYFDILFSPEMKEIVNISREKSDFITPIEIESGYYVERQLSADRIVNKLKKIAEMREDILDLRVCFKEEE